MGISWKPRFRKLEYELKMRLLKTPSHIAERQGNEARSTAVCIAQSCAVEFTYMVGRLVDAGGILVVVNSSDSRGGASLAVVVMVEAKRHKQRILYSKASLSMVLLVNRL